MSIQMFVNREDCVIIPVYVYENTNSEIEATSQKKLVPSDKQVETVNFTFRKPNFSDSNEFMRKFVSSRTNLGEDQAASVDIFGLQDYIMTQMLSDWTLKDEDGTKSKLTKANVGMLAPAIGRAAAIGYLDVVRFQ